MVILKLHTTNVVLLGLKCFKGLTSGTSFTLLRNHLDFRECFRSRTRSNQSNNNLRFFVSGFVVGSPNEFGVEKGLSMSQF